jgi:uncharacterized protein
MSIPYLSDPMKHPSVVGRGRVVRQFSAAIALAVAIAGCAEPDPNAVPRTNIITGSTGSSWYTIGAAIAERTNLQFPGYPLMGVPGAGGVSNPARVARLGDDMGITHLPFLRAAYLGSEPYHQPYPELRHVATIIQNKLHLLISDRVGVRDLEEIVNRRIAVRVGTGPPGSGEEFLFREVLEFYGASIDDLRSWGGRVDLLGTGQRADAWRDNHVDVLVFSINDPAAVVSEMLHARDARMWSVPDDVIDALVERWGVVRAEIRAGTYPGQAEPVTTIGLPAAIFATDEVDERIVYALTKTIAEGKPYLETVHGGFRSLEVSDMLVNGGVPVHPGALRYFRERGWITQ